MRGVHAGGDAVFHGPIHGFPEIALLRYIHKPAAGRFLRLFRGLWPNGAGRQLRDVLPVYMLRIVLAATLPDALRFLRLFLIKYVRMGELRLDHIAADRADRADRPLLAGGCAAGVGDVRPAGIYRVI